MGTNAQKRGTRERLQSIYVKTMMGVEEMGRKGGGESKNMCLGDIFVASVQFARLECGICILGVFLRRTCVYRNNANFFSKRLLIKYSVLVSYMT